jgi:hypothetical protein
LYRYVMAARDGAGITTTYPRGKHLAGDDKKCSKTVLDLVWNGHVEKRLKKGGLGLTELWTAARQLIRPRVLEPVEESEEDDSEEESEGEKGGSKDAPVVLSASGRVSRKAGLYSC